MTKELYWGSFFFRKSYTGGGGLFDERAILGGFLTKRAILRRLFDERVILRGLFEKRAILGGRFLTNELY